MALSSDLISKFVKATKDEPTAQKETVVYGVVTQLDPVRVKLIETGSASDTSAVYGESIPVASQTTVVEVGDKVECTIKNHKLSITGTSEHPAARDASTINVSQLNASNARIDNLEAANADIQGTLTANNADIENLKASNAEITGRLTANEADIEYLKALDIDTEKLNAAYAFVEDLEASNADVDYLVATVADIDELMFGSAGGDVIQTSFSNAVIAQLGDAQIKSAMIESVSADKITAGDIITNNVRVMSVDGSLIISDETLQISDGTRVRVQIGKDASNDYSINIWDQNGNLMFSKGGITDAAIKEAIIRNDMVSDTANIHASKLDIDSLFEEINGSSNTIKSTQVKLDDRNQTLDVAFKSLTSEITSQGNTISSQGTAISTIQGQISSKIWQQDINTAKNEMSTQYSTLEQEVDSFKTTVSETYATKTALASTDAKAVAAQADIDNLEVGGRNLLIGTNRGSANWAYGGNDGTHSKESYTDTEGTNCVKLTCGVAASSWCFAQYSAQTMLNKLLPNTEYMLSFDMLTDVEEALSLSIRRGDGSKSLTNVTASITTVGDESWHKYTFLLNTNDLSVGIDNQVVYFSRFNTVGYRIIKNLKLERGNIATDWSPAPDDIQADISDVETRVTTAETTISQNTAAINLRATKTEVSAALANYSTTSQMTSAINLKADEITSSVALTYTTQAEFDTLTIGGRNLFSGYGEEEIQLRDYNGVGGFTQFTNLTFDPADYIGKEFTISFWAKSPNGSTPLMMYNQNGNPRYFHFSTTLDGDLNTEWKYYTYTFTNTDRGESYTGIYKRIEIYASKQLGVLVKKIKIEMGNRATDWSPAPEDVETEIAANRTLIEQTATDLTVQIESAAKTATNYLNFSSSGLVIGDLTASTLGKNVLIDSDSVDIRNGDTTLASFGADYLYLAKNSRNAKIDLCNGLATMYHESKYSYDTLFIIDTPNATEIQGTYNPLCVTSTVSGKVSIQFANTSGVIGSIGMVESGTESYITRNHPSTATTYSILDTGNYYKLMDSGWIYGGAIGDGFSIYADDTQIQYRKIGKTVHIRGAVKPTKDIAGSTTSYTLFTLPSGYRPSAPVYARCQGSAANTWMLSVTSAGAVRFSRYGYGSTYVTATAGTWLPFDVTFFID